MTTTPETDAELLMILMDRGVVDHRNAPENLVNKCRELEMNRNEWKERAAQNHGMSPEDIERLLCACLPGGDSCDPQKIADEIRDFLLHNEIGHAPGAKEKANE